MKTDIEASSHSQGGGPCRASVPERGPRRGLTMDVRGHGLMGVVFTLHEQQQLLSGRNLYHRSVEDLPVPGDEESKK